MTNFGAGGTGETDDTEALRNCIAEARKAGKIVWVPAGDYKLTGDIILPSNVTVQGAACGIRLLLATKGFIASRTGG